MATITLKAIEDAHIGDIYKTMTAGETVRLTRSVDDFGKMKSLSDRLREGKITVSVTLSEGESAEDVSLPNLE